MPISMFSKKKVLYQSGQVKTKEVALQTINWDNLSQESYNPDAVGVSTYKNMMKDAEVKAAFSLIKFSTLSRNWKVVYSEKAKDSEEIVKFLRYCFDHMDGRLNGSLSNFLYAIPYGFAVSEIVYKIIKEGEFSGKVGIRKIKGLDPETIAFKTDKYGNLKNVYQEPQEIGSEKIDLPLDRLIVYTNEKEFGNYYGNSRLRSVYKNWFIKDAVTKFWNIALERFGMPMLIGRVPSPKDLEEMRTTLMNAQAKSSLATVEGWEISTLETGIGRSSGGDYKSCLDYHNGQICKGMLIPESLVGGAAGGSFAKAKVGFDLFVLMLKSLETDLCSIVEQYLIKPLLVYNFGELDEYPQFVFEPLTKAEFLELAKVFSLLVRNGVVGADESWIRDMLRVPKRSETSVSSDTRNVDSGEEEGKNPPPETKIIKTEEGGKVIESPKNKRTVKKKTQQVKVPQTSRSSGM